MNKLKTIARKFLRLRQSFKKSPPEIPGIEKIYSKYLSDKAFFVEVGANDGDTGSNTAFLADKGWPGIYIEPVYYELCKKRHAKNPNVAVFPVACGNYDGTVKITTAGLYSSCSENYIHDIETLPKDWNFNLNKQKIEVPIFKLDTLLAGRPVDLLLIDTEGFEKEVLEGFSGSPRLIVIEMHEKSPEWQFDWVKQNNTWINGRLKDYSRIYSDSINTIFLKN